MTADPAIIERFKRAVEDERRHPQVTAAYRKWDRDESEWGCGVADRYGMASMTDVDRERAMTEIHEVLR